MSWKWKYKHYMQIPGFLSKQVRPMALQILKRFDEKL